MTEHSEFILVRKKPNGGEPASFSIWRKSANPDLTEHTFLRVNENGMDEYCHKDDYKVYKKIFDKVDKRDDFNT